MAPVCRLSQWCGHAHRAPYTQATAPLCAHHFDLAEGPRHFDSDPEFRIRLFRLILISIHFSFWHGSGSRFSFWFRSGTRFHFDSGPGSNFTLFRQQLLVHIKKFTIVLKLVPHFFVENNVWYWYLQYIVCRLQHLFWPNLFYCSPIATSSLQFWKGFIDGSPCSGSEMIGWIGMSGGG